MSVQEHSSIFRISSCASTNPVLISLTVDNALSNVLKTSLVVIYNHTQLIILNTANDTNPTAAVAGALTLIAQVVKAIELNTETPNIVISMFTSIFILIFSFARWNFSPKFKLNTQKQTLIGLT